jgi:hypothetical protein
LVNLAFRVLTENSIMAKSLLDGINTNARRGSGSGDNTNKIKLIAASALLIVAIGVLAWYYVLRDTTPALPPVDPAQVEAAKEQQERAVEQAKRQGASLQGGD